MPQLQFLGATGTVTGSKYLLTVNKQRILIDCGLYQGPRALRERNHVPLPIRPEQIDAVVLTHAHLDHTGYLPRLVADGFRGKAYCTSGTASLLEILLPDSAHLLEEEARYKSKHRAEPKLPLYTAADAVQAIGRLEPVAFHKPFAVLPGVTGTYRRAGHILGAATLELKLVENDRETVLVCSGDLGRTGMLLMPDPEPVSDADVLLLESTYGDRLHPPETAEQALAAVVDEAVADHAVLLIPAFAVGRTQELLAHLQRLQEADIIPRLPIYLDSPMAIEATEMMQAHTEDLRPAIGAMFARGESPIGALDLTLTRTPEESKALNDVNGPAIIISASGMANGGRILHHLRRRLDDRRTIVCLSGFQAEGTLGRALHDGAESVNILGKPVDVQARIRNLPALSAHADQAGLLAWAKLFRRPPLTFVVHGEPEPAQQLANRLSAQGSVARVPALGEKVELPTRPLAAPAPASDLDIAIPVTASDLDAPIPVAPPAEPAPARRRTIGVMGSSATDALPQVASKARYLGQAIAAADCILLTGACPGLPDICATGAKEAGGLTVGISPAMSHDEHIGRYDSPVAAYDVMIYTGSGLMGREVTNIRSSDAIIVVGGRSGTLGEFAIAYDEGKLIGILKGTGGLTDHVDTLIHICNKDTGAVVICDTDPERLVERLLRMLPDHGKAAAVDVNGAVGLSV